MGAIWPGEIMSDARLYITPGADRMAPERLHLGGFSFLAECAFSFTLEPELVDVAAERVGGFALATDAADSALLVTLSPGDYTIQVASAGGAQLRRPTGGRIRHYRFGGAALGPYIRRPR